MTALMSSRPGLDHDGADMHLHDPGSLSRAGVRTRRRPRRLLSAAAATLLLVGVATTSQAATRVTVTNPGGLTVVGPVNTAYGFPAWYQDKNNVRVEPCLDIDDSLCGFLPGDVPDPEAPITFPDNFPEEFFYQLADSSLTLPGGGKAALTLGLEASFANGDPIAGDQVTFARTRVTVVGGPRSQTLTFKHPFGELTIDTDATGKGRLVQDITPAVGNFSTALGSNFGPFLKWDPAVAPAAPVGYLGDPAQTHSVVGGLNGYNLFSTVVAGQTVSNNQFGVSGKVATNTGVVGDRAVTGHGFLDVFATSTGSQLQVDGVDGQYATTPMTTDGSGRHYARIALLGSAKPTSVTVRNLGDKPASTAVIKLADVSIAQADYDGTKLTVAAQSDNFPLTVTAFGTLPDAQPVSFDTIAPPASITVRSANGTPVTYPVTVVAGAATDPGLPPVPPTPAGPPVIDNTPDNPAAPGATVVVAEPAATQPGGSVVLDASATTGATAYRWAIDPTTPAGVTLAGGTTSKPTVTLPFFTSISATAPTADWAPVTLTLTTTDASGGTATKQVTVPVKRDAVVVGAARHRVGTELRVDGTSLIDGLAGARTPPTSVVVWDTTNPARPVKLGTSPVDTVGAWSVRLKPGPSVQVTTMLVQSTRGGTTVPTVVR